MAFLLELRPYLSFSVEFLTHLILWRVDPVKGYRLLSVAEDPAQAGRVVHCLSPTARKILNLSLCIFSSRTFVIPFAASPLKGPRYWVQYYIVIYDGVGGEMNTHKHTLMTPFNHWSHWGVKNDLDSSRLVLRLRRLCHPGRCQVMWGEMGRFSKLCSVSVFLLGL